ncbi:hypothetical protein [Caulobacter sp. 17J65-9]|uniref:hypothetical protein n=1 Tax=Caulobacter sp. 17J65-9 TaxID=2709382 RepID=UPI0013C70259|nr:hypothetical protein [Caulobacter sp. 17J65-9]NEX92969.1 hypothetical protein [Caulobacter sp. 17J65-9]
MPLDLSSEPFPANGAIAGEGARKLLGTPTLTLLQTLARESGQNAWDARASDSVRMQVRLRTLDEAQAACLRSEILANLPESTHSHDLLEPARTSSCVTVLEISDFGGVGLGGPTRADIASPDKTARNFINLVRNIGAGRDIAGGGGTYGFGKMALFAASECSTVLLDSLAVDASGSVERRFIGCHVGEEYVGANGRRFTGRHWWGRSPDEPDASGGFVEPLLADEAEAIAEGLGLPRRVAADTGTTIMILLPRVENLHDAAAEIRAAFLWFFWPKMIAEGGAEPPMTFAIEAEGETLLVPSPEHFPPLDLFVQAWRLVKSSDPQSRAVICERPRKLLGRMAITRGFRGDRKYGAETGPIQGSAHHVALMRPVELVVKYLPGTPLPHEAHEWAGVFICNDDVEVEEAFARSEPPAHDDWMPNSLPKGPAQTWVNVGLRRVGQLASEIVHPAQSGTATTVEQPPLGSAAARLGQLMPRSVEDEDRVRRGTIRGRRRAWSVEPAEFITLEPVEGGVSAVFRVQARNSSAEPLAIRAMPGLVLDDRISGEIELPDGGKVVTQNWTTASGEHFATGEIALLPAGSFGDFRIRVLVPGLAAVGLSLDVED